jgi:pyruvate dehydrogenase E1 component beta subunit
MMSAIRDNNPVVFLEQKTLYAAKGAVPDGDYTVPIGKADVKHTGSDITIVSYGRMLPVCLDAAQQLEAQEGISVEVVDLRTLVPLDRDTIIQSVKKTGRLLIVHEASRTGGFGGEIAVTVAESDAFSALASPIRRCCGLDVPVPFSPELEASVVPSVQQLIDEVKSMTGCGRRAKAHIV